MIKVTVDESKNNLDHYLSIAKSEEIEVTEKDRIVFTMYPHSLDLLNELRSYFGSLPKEAYDDTNIDRE